MDKMLDDLITGLNMIEVRGRHNLALLYNAIDTASKLKEVAIKLDDVVVEETDENMANETE